MAINGQLYDWEDITVTLPSGEAIGITEIKYEDGQEVEPRYGRGSTPRGYGRKNYESSGSMVLDRDEGERLHTALMESSSGGIYDHKPFPIVVAYANNDMGQIVDTLKSCKITKITGGGAAQGDDNASPFSYDFKILEPILYNGVPAKISGGASFTL